MIAVGVVVPGGHIDDSGADVGGQQIGGRMQLPAEIPSLGQHWLVPVHLLSRRRRPLGQIEQAAIGLRRQVEQWPVFGSEHGEPLLEEVGFIPITRRQEPQVLSRRQRDGGGALRTQVGRRPTERQADER